MAEATKERVYHEVLVVLSGMGIKSNNMVMMPNGVVITAQEYLEEKLRFGENLSGITDKITVEKLQEQLNSKVKALAEIRANIEEHNQIYDLDANTALLLEVIDGIAFKTLAVIGGNDDRG